MRWRVVPPEKRDDSEWKSPDTKGPTYDSLRVRCPEQATPRNRGQTGGWPGPGRRSGEWPVHGSGVCFAVMEVLWPSIEVIFSFH